jgi:hypothetical protein
MNNYLNPKFLFVSKRKNERKKKLLRKTRKTVVQIENSLINDRNAFIKWKNNFHF